VRFFIDRARTGPSSLDQNVTPVARTPEHEAPGQTSRSVTPPAHLHTTTSATNRAFLCHRCNAAVRV
jgi:hypothetical protein